jgi:GDP-L-fucose synthase
MGEDALLTGKLEPTNEPYAIAKIAGIKLCESYNRQYGHLHGIDYRSVMPTNLYGPGDNYDTVNCHVIPALIKRFHEAKVNNLEMVEIWGTGTARREFLHVDDMAAASVFVMELDKKILDTQTTPMQSHINIGFGEDITIYKLSHLISKVIGYKGNICFDSSKPDGPPRKNLNSTCIQSLGWRPTIEFEEGLRLTYLAYCKQLV